MAFLLYLDEDLLERRLVRGLRAAGIDVVTASDAETAGWLDADQLVFARSLGRVILAANVKDFAALHGRWMAAGEHHAGILMLIDQRAAVRVIVAKVARLQALRDAATMIDATLYLNGRADQPLE